MLFLCFSLSLEITVWPSLRGSWGHINLTFRWSQVCSFHLPHGSNIAFCKQAWVASVSSSDFWQLINRAFFTACQTVAEVVWAVRGDGRGGACAQSGVGCIFFCYWGNWHSCGGIEVQLCYVPMYAAPHTHPNGSLPRVLSHANDQTQECQVLALISWLCSSLIAFGSVFVFVCVCASGLFSVSVMNMRLALAVTVQTSGCVFKPLGVHFWWSGQSCFRPSWPWWVRNACVCIFAMSGLNIRQPLQAALTRQQDQLTSEVRLCGAAPQRSTQPLTKRIWFLNSSAHFMVLCCRCSPTSNGVFCQDVSEGGFCAPSRNGSKWVNLWSHCK